MKRTKRTIVILSLALASCQGTIAKPTVTPQTVSVRILATTATYPLLQEFIAEFDRPGTLLLVHSAVANWETIHTQLQTGVVPFALVSYLPAHSNLWVAPVGQDGIAIIVHRSNAVPSLTTHDLRLIFQGRLTNWAELSGPDQPIRVVSREAGADTRLVFETLVMHDQRTTLNARLALSSQSMTAIVAENPGAIGYVSMAWANPPLARDPVRVMPISDAADQPPQFPTPQTVSNGVYPLRNPILIVGAHPPAAGSIYREWFAWMQSATGQSIVQQQYGMNAH